MGHHPILLSLALLLITTTTHTAGHGDAQAAAVTQGMGVGSMMRGMVGSRPPSCAGRCWWCGGRRCEAVQVPITPQDLQIKKRSHGGHGHGRGSSRSGGGGASAAVLQPSSYDDHSNYKPLSWRCKCGGV